MRLLALGMALWLSVATAYAQDPLFRVGGGIGVGFGRGVGIGVETEWNRIALLGSIGIGSPYGDWDAGARYFFKVPGARIRPHASVLYGPAQIVRYTFLDGPEAGKYTAVAYGASVLGGIDHDFATRGGFMMSYGLGVIVPGELPSEHKERIESAGGDAKTDLGLALSIGIKYQF